MSRPDVERRRELLLEWAREEGFDPVGVTPAAPSAHAGHLETWIERSLHGTMQYLARPDALERRRDPSLSLDGARSILVVAHNYHGEDPPGVPNDPSRGVIARYARGRDYHRVMKKALLRIHRKLEEAEGEAVPARAYVDTGPLLERELGMRAGLGWFGRNTMLIHPRRGSWFFLGCLLLGVEVRPDAPFERDHCGSCRACLDACPTGALLGRDEDGAPVMDARRCISYLTIENDGPIPREFREAMGNRVYGCDICQEACPFSKAFAREAAEPGYAARGPGERPVGVEALPGERDPEAPDAAESGGRSDASMGQPSTHPGTDGPPLTELLRTALSEEAWDAFSRGSAIRRAGRAGFARNVCVAMGNWLGATEDSDPAAVRLLERALSDSDPLVRGHAAWALGRSAGEDARELLSLAAASEADAWVVEELEAARWGSRGKSLGELGDGAR
jgi:epoxyqueuosine reductase